MWNVYDVILHDELNLLNFHDIQYRKISICTYTYNDECTIAFQPIMASDGLSKFKSDNGQILLCMSICIT